MSDKITGGCLCGAVKFSIENSFKNLYFCHCDQCRKLSGTAHVSNLFTSTDSIEWTSGESVVQTYYHAERGFSNAFCKHCGSPVPRINKSRKALIVPMGSLDTEPKVEKKMHIFTTEEPKWSELAASDPRHAKFP